MASVRLDPELERQIAKAARRRRQSKSDFIRDAVREKTTEVLSEDSSSLWELVDLAAEGHDSTPIKTEWGDFLSARHERETAEFLEELARRRARPH